MLPQTNPLIEAVTEPLADNAERRMAAQHLLSGTFDTAHPAIAGTTARIEATGRRKFPVWRKALPWVLAAIALAVTVFSHVPMIRIGATLFDYNLFDPWEKPALPPGLTKEQRLLLGDPDEDEFDQKRRLHAHAPENPAYFAEYAQGYLSETESLPPDFLETAARIAPDNAFFPYIAAGQIVKKCMTKKRRSDLAAAHREKWGHEKCEKWGQCANLDRMQGADFEEVGVAAAGEKSALDTWEKIVNFTTDEWFPSRLSFGKFKGRREVKAENLKR